MHSIQSALQAAQAQLVEASALCAPNADTDAYIDARYASQLLLQHILQRNRAWLITHADAPLTAAHQQAFDALVQRRAQGEPIAYLLGYREFYGLKLAVTPATLIPRPDTELLVDIALKHISISKQASILDMGTGSGAIALAIAQHRPQASITAVDASRDALEVAIKNGHMHACSNVQFVLSDWFDAMTGQRFDVIVSNPPYIESADMHLQQGDLRFEPISALAAGTDGLDDIRSIIACCLIHLNPQGWLMLEHGYNQAQAVHELMTQAGLITLQTFKDHGGNDRVTIGQNPLIVSTHWD